MILGVGGGRIQNGRVCRNTDAVGKAVKPVDVSRSTGVSDTSVARIGSGFLVGSSDDRGSQRALVLRVVGWW